MSMTEKLSRKVEVLVAWLFVALLSCGLYAAPAYADLNEAGDSGFSESESGAGTNEPMGSWRVDSHGWWYELANSSYPRSQWLDLGGTWYWFDAGGYMVTGWAPVGGGWYYFDSSGAMATGWRVVDGSWNYFMANGAWVSDYMDAKAQSYSSNTNWLILVDTSRCVTSIYTGSWNNWSLNRRYVCSTGKASTPTVIGEYQVYGKGYSFGHGYTCYYYTQFYGDYLFHSSPYYVNSNRVMDPTMGVPSSAGCVRLEIQNAKWIYDNIPYGTKVVTY